MNRLVVKDTVYNLDHVRKAYIGGDYIKLYFIDGYEYEIYKLSSVSIDPEIKSLEDVDKDIHYVGSNENQEFFVYKKEDIDKEWDRIVGILKG